MAYKHQANGHVPTPVHVVYAKKRFKVTAQGSTQNDMLIRETECIKRLQLKGKWKDTITSTDRLKTPKFQFGQILCSTYLPK